MAKNIHIYIGGKTKDGVITGAESALAKVRAANSETRRVYASSSITKEEENKLERAYKLLDQVEQILTSG
jgi:hypothetical protein